MKIGEQKYQINPQVKKRYPFIKRIITIALMVVFFYSAYNIITINATYREIEQATQSIRNDYLVVIPPPMEPTINPLLNREFISVDWDGLLARNQDVVGWIYIPGTNVNYPILEGQTNDEYLNLDLDRNWTVAGSIFLEENNSSTFSDNNTIIYGHNMLNGVKFSEIDQLVRGNLDVADSPYVYIYLPNGMVNIFEIVSLVETNRYSYLYHLPVNDLDFFYEQMTLTSRVDIPFDRSLRPRVLTLSTCGEGFRTPVRKIAFGILLGEVMVPSSE